MIYFIDDFFDRESYDELSSQLKGTNFEEQVVGDKSFFVKPSSASIDNVVCSKIEMLEGRPIRNILSFFRVSTDRLDTDWRIHSDQKINGEQPERALVLFMSPSESTAVMNGTAFWEHKNYGHSLPYVSDGEFDRLLQEDANDTSKWKLNSVIGHRENRVVSYPASYFHSKYPAMSWSSGRIVFVMFYSYG